MKKYVFIAMAVVIGYMISGCASTPKATGPAAVPEENMVLSMPKDRPEWIIKEPETEGDKYIFIGLSAERVATEKDARDDAQNTAIKNVAKYMGTYVNDKIERIATAYGLSSDIVNPTKVSRDREEQLTKAFASRVKASDWYLEKWQNKLKESYWKAYVKTTVPKVSMDEEFKDLMNGSIEQLKKQRDAASDEKAKTQYENAMNAFEDAKQKGFTLEK
ncbi:MAG: hypothetical protein ABII64_04355 [Elusimicrobiota bacterium]